MVKDKELIEKESQKSEILSETKELLEEEKSLVFKKFLRGTWNKVGAQDCVLTFSIFESDKNQNEEDDQDKDNNDEGDTEIDPKDEQDREPQDDGKVSICSEDSSYTFSIIPTEGFGFSLYNEDRQSATLEVLFGNETISINDSEGTVDRFFPEKLIGTFERKQ